MSNRPKLRPGGDPAPGLLRTDPAPPGTDCSWCDCSIPDPMQVPGGPVIMIGHDEARCAGCDRPAEFVVQVDVEFLAGMVGLTACRVHRGAVEADLSAALGVSR